MSHTKQAQHSAILASANLAQSLYPYQQVFVICIGDDPRHIDAVAISVDETIRYSKPSGFTVIQMTQAEYDYLNQEEQE